MIKATDAPVDVPNCPRCATPMQLLRVVPNITHGRAETHVFGCERCGTTIMRTIRSDQ
jgi:hypothetical protein